jgi:uncharacterized protein YndB with AHSA1/START domain
MAALFLNHGHPMLNARALLLATLLGTVLQVAMVVSGHHNTSVASLFAVGGMGISLVAGVLYAMWARGQGTAGVVVGGLCAGAICAFIGILVSHLLGDVPRSLLVLGTMSSAITGALGGWIGTFLFRPGMATVALIVVVSGSASAQNVSPIVTEGIVEAPLDSVWAAWSTSDGLRGWLAPHAEIDLRLGGLMRTNYDPEGVLGDRRTIENVVLSFEPRRMLSIRVAKAPDEFPFPNAIQEMWSVVYFDEAGPDRTTVRVVSLGFRPEEESQRMRSFFDSGNTATIEALQRRFATQSNR